MPRPIARTAALVAACWRASRQARRLLLRGFLWTVGLGVGTIVGWFALSLVSAAPATAAEATTPALELASGKPFLADGDGGDDGGGGGDAGAADASDSTPSADDSSSSDTGTDTASDDPSGGDPSGPGADFEGGPGGGVGGIDGNGSTSDDCSSCDAVASAPADDGSSTETDSGPDPVNQPGTVGGPLAPGGASADNPDSSADTPDPIDNTFGGGPGDSTLFSGDQSDYAAGDPNANADADAETSYGPDPVNQPGTIGGPMGDSSDNPGSIDNGYSSQSGLPPDQASSIDALATVGQADQDAADSGTTDQSAPARGPPVGTAQGDNGVTFGQDTQGNPVIIEPAGANGNVTTYTANGTLTYAPDGTTTHQALETTNLTLPDGSYANGQELPSGSGARVFDNVDTVSSPAAPDTGLSSHTENDQVEALVSTDPANGTYTPVHSAQIDGTVTAPGLSAPVAVDDQMPRGDFFTADGYQIGTNVGGQQPGAPTVSATPGADSTSAAQGNPSVATVANAPGLEELPDQNAVLPNGYGTGESTAPVNYGQALYATDSLTGITQAPQTPGAGSASNNPLAPGGPFLQQGPDSGDHAGNPVWGQVLGSPSVVDSMDPSTDDPLVAEHNQTSIQQMQSAANGLDMTTSAAMNAYANPTKDAANEAITGGQSLNPDEASQTDAVLQQTQSSTEDATGKLMVGYDTAAQAAAVAAGTPNDPATTALTDSVNNWLANPTDPANMAAVNNAAAPIVNGSGPLAGMQPGYTGSHDTQDGLLSAAVRQDVVTDANGTAHSLNTLGQSVTTDPTDAQGDTTSYTADANHDVYTNHQDGSVTHQAVNTFNSAVPDGSTYADGRPVPTGSAQRVVVNVNTVSGAPDMNGQSVHTENDQVQAFLSTDPTTGVYNLIKAAPVSGTTTAPDLSAPAAEGDPTPRGDFFTANGYLIGQNVGGQLPGAPTLGPVTGTGSTDPASGNPNLASVANTPGLGGLPDDQFVSPNGYGTGNTGSPATDLGQALYAYDNLTGVSQGNASQPGYGTGGPFIQQPANTGQGDSSAQQQVNPGWAQTLGSPSVVDTMDPSTGDPVVAAQNESRIQQIQTTADGLANTTDAATSAYANPYADPTATALTNGDYLTPQQVDVTNAFATQTQDTAQDATGKLMVGYAAAVQAAADNQAGDPSVAPPAATAAATDAANVNQTVNAWLADPTKANAGGVDGAAASVINGTGPLAGLQPAYTGSTQTEQALMAAAANESSNVQTKADVTPTMNSPLPTGVESGWNAATGALQSDGDSVGQKVADFVSGKDLGVPQDGNWVTNFATGLVGIAARAPSGASNLVHSAVVEGANSWIYRNDPSIQKQPGESWTQFANRNAAINPFTASTMNLLNSVNDTWGNAVRGDPTNLVNMAVDNPAQLLANTAMVAAPGLKILSGSAQAGAAAADDAASSAASDAFEADSLANRPPTVDPLIAPSAETPEVAGVPEAPAPVSAVAAPPEAEGGEAIAAPVTVPEALAETPSNPGAQPPPPGAQPPPAASADPPDIGGGTPSSDGAPPAASSTASTTTGNGTNTPEQSASAPEYVPGAGEDPVAGYQDPMTAEPAAPPAEDPLIGGRPTTEVSPVEGPPADTPVGETSAVEAAASTPTGAGYLDEIPAEGYTPNTATIAADTVPAETRAAAAEQAGQSATRALRMQSLANGLRITAKGLDTASSIGLAPYKAYGYLGRGVSALGGWAAGKLGEVAEGAAADAEATGATRAGALRGTARMLNTSGSALRSIGSNGLEGAITNALADRNAYRTLGLTRQQARDATPSDIEAARNRALNSIEAATPEEKAGQEQQINNSFVRMMLNTTSSAGALSDLGANNEDNAATPASDDTATEDAPLTGANERPTTDKPADDGAQNAGLAPAPSDERPASPQIGTAPAPISASPTYGYQDVDPDADPQIGVGAERQDGKPTVVSGQSTSAEEPAPRQHIGSMDQPVDPAYGKPVGEQHTLLNRIDAELPMGKGGGMTTRDIAQQLGVPQRDVVNAIQHAGAGRYNYVDFGPDAPDGIGMGMALKVTQERFGAGLRNHYVGDEGSSSDKTEPRDASEEVPGPDRTPPQAPTNGGGGQELVLPTAPELVSGQRSRGKGKDGGLLRRRTAGRGR